MVRKLEIDIGGHVFTATLLENKAPKTCEAFLKKLPYEGMAQHSSWSGYSLVVAHLPTEGLPRENTRIYGSAGEVLWDVGFSLGTVFVAHGLNQFRHPGGFHYCNLFAKITEKLEELDSVGFEILREGRKKIAIKAV